MLGIRHPAAGLAGLVALAVGVVLAWPGASAPGQEATHAGAPGTVRVVALGDSVTAGTACDCDAFPVVYGRLLQAALGRPTSVSNFGSPGLDSGGLLQRLDADTQGVAQAVSGADVVLVTIGANDFNDHHEAVTDGDCGHDDGHADCVSDELESMQQNLTKILRTINSLRHGSAADVLVTGYWNDFEDGEVARNRYSDDGLRATVGLTRRTNRAIQGAVLATHTTYVDLSVPFHEEHGGVTKLLAADGDHPNAAGHRLIARLLLRAGLPMIPAATLPAA